MFAPSCSSSQETPFLWKRHELASKVRGDDILGFTIVFRIPTNGTDQSVTGRKRWHFLCVEQNRKWQHFGLPENTAQINQLQAEKCWHFLFGEQNRKWHHFGLNRCLRYPEKHLCMKTAQINQRKNAEKCWHFLFGKRNRKWSHF